MIKEANTQFPVHELIKKRWSARAFSGQQITQEELFTLIEAASWAPSSVNEQPWNYLYAFHDTEGFSKMLDLLSVGNQLWVKDASVLLMCTANKNFAKSGEFNRHYMHDMGLANANLLMQAVSMNIYGHLLGGFDKVRTDDFFSIPDHQEVVCFLALGYLGEAESLEEPFKTREVTPRNRKPVEEIAQQF